MGTEKVLYDEKQAIRQAVAVYEEAVQSANPDAFRRAFHPEALLARPLVPGGPLVSLPLQDYQGNAETLYDGEVAVKEETTNVTIDVAGHVAVARLDFHVRVANEEFEGSDFLNLAKINGRWVVTYVLWDLSPSG